MNEIFSLLGILTALVVIALGGYAFHLSRRDKRLLSELDYLHKRSDISRMAPPLPARISPPASNVSVAPAPYQPRIYQPAQPVQPSTPSIPAQTQQRQETSGYSGMEMIGAGLLGAAATELIHNQTEVTRRARASSRDEDTTVAPAANSLNHTTEFSNSSWRSSAPTVEKSSYSYSDDSSYSSSSYSDSSSSSDSGSSSSSD